MGGTCYPVLGVKSKNTVRGGRENLGGTQEKLGNTQKKGPTGE